MNTKEKKHRKQGLNENCAKEKTCKKMIQKRQLLYN